LFSGFKHFPLGVQVRRGDKQLEKKAGVQEEGRLPISLLAVEFFFSPARGLYPSKNIVGTIATTASTATTAAAAKISVLSKHLRRVLEER